jgi:NAD(P)H-flavin reductase
MKPIVFTATVLSNEYIAEETRKTIFEISSDHKDTFVFTTGQFVNLMLLDENGKKIMRGYSIASSASRLPRFELCVKVIENGRGSGLIDRLQVGDTAEFMGPFGHFGQKSPEKNLLMVATGTGIAPMKAIIDELAEKNFPTPTTLVFGIREKKYAPYLEYFEKLQKEHENFSFHLWVSRPSSSEESIGEKGRVTDFLQKKSPEFFEGREVIMCGNPHMIKEAKNILLQEKMVEKSSIVVESY